MSAAVISNNEFILYDSKYEFSNGFTYEFNEFIYEFSNEFTYNCNYEFKYDDFYSVIAALPQCLSHIYNYNYIYYLQLHNYSYNSILSFFIIFSNAYLLVEISILS